MTADYLSLEGHNHGVNPDCLKCEGGFYSIDQGDGCWEEYNCDCMENECDCNPCRTRLATYGVPDCPYCAEQRNRAAA